MTPEEIAAIKAKPESERTEDEKKALAAAERKPDQFPTSWEEVFQHPRFKQLNDRANQAERTLKELQDAEAERERKALEEQGKWQELAETRLRKIDELQGKASAAQSYEDVLSEILDEQKKNLPKESVALIPDSLSVSEQLRWVTRNRAILEKEPAPGDIGARRRSSQPPPKDVKLTDEEKATAKRFGYSDEEYIKWRGSGEETQPTE